MRAPLVMVLLTLALPWAGAQTQQTEACRVPALAMQPVPAALDPGQSYSLTFSIENPNGPPVDSVLATVTTTAPAGWTATPSPKELTLGPRNATFGALVVTAPNRGSGEAAGKITLFVTFTCRHGEILTSASSASVLEVQIKQFQAPWPVVLTAFLALLVGVTVLGVRRLRRGVGVWVQTPSRTVEPGKSTKYTFGVENRRGKPQRFTLLALGVPDGWSIHLALDKLELEPGEEKLLWAILKAPPGAAPGADVDLQLRFESSKTARDSVVLRLTAKVVPPP